MFLNIRLRAIPDIWLSLFPTIFDGVQVPPLEAPETLGVPPVPPFPRFFFTDTFGSKCNASEVAQ
jgi:hypothetical protein